MPLLLLGMILVQLIKEMLRILWLVQLVMMPRELRLEMIRLVKPLIQMLIRLLFLLIIQIIFDQCSE